MTSEDVLHILQDLAPKWLGADYHVLNKNCLLFSQAFLDKLCPGVIIPSWSTSTAQNAQFLGYFIPVEQRMSLSTNISKKQTEKMWKEASLRMTEFLKTHKEKVRESRPASIPTIIHSESVNEEERSLNDTLAELQALHFALNKNKGSYSKLARSCLH